MLNNPDKLIDESVKVLLACLACSYASQVGWYIVGDQNKSKYYVYLQGCHKVTLLHVLFETTHGCALVA